jgi:predicted acylesterase/phospholipase RssA/CRP-like cAMP-binding protein
MTDVATRGLRTAAVFVDLDDEDVAGLEQPPEVRVLEAGEVLVRQGDEGGDCYVLVDGELRVDVTTDAGAVHTVATFAPGAIVGELSAVAGGRREATVTATCAAEVVSLHRGALAELLDRRPDVAARVADVARRRLRENQLLRQLTALFGSHGNTVFPSLAAAVRWVELPAGETLFHAGDPADGAYVVVSGRVRVIEPTPSGEAVHVGDVGQGELLGEMALLEGDGVGRTATIVAARDTELAFLPRAAFDELMAAHPGLMLVVARTILRRRRMRPASQRCQVGRCIAVVAASADAPVADLTAQLAEELRRFGTVAHLSRDRVDAAFGRSGAVDAVEGTPTGIRLAHWLHEVESAHDYVLLEADPEPTAWSHRAVRGADGLLLVADADASPRPQGVEAAMEAAIADRSAPARVLALVHPSTRRLPSGTGRWLDVRELEQHVHLRREHAGDLGRLARILAGRAVSVVLGGGGARGFAHIGVVETLESLGVPVDMLGGTSIGSAMGALLGKDLRGAEMVARTREHFRTVVDYTLPIAALNRGRRLNQAVDGALAGIDIADLWVPFFCVSTDLTTASARVHRRGSAATAVRASVSIPGVYPPVAVDGHLLVDGGVVDNIPVSTMRRLNPTGTIIAVDVAPDEGLPPAYDVGRDVHGLALLYDILAPWRRRPAIPTMPETMLRSLLVSATREREQILREGLADLYLTIDVREYGPQQFDRVPQGAAAGRRQSRAPIEAWLAEHGVTW